MKSVQHAYSAAALRCIDRINKLGEVEQQQYGSLCHRFPSMVMLNGLRLTVAFFSVDKGMRNTFLHDLEQALGVENLAENMPERMDDYRDLTRRALAAAVWFKRYAEAVLGITQGEAADVEAEELL